MEDKKTFHVSFLGTVALKSGENSVLLETRKATALLAFLCVTGQDHRREALETMFWGEHDQQSAQSNLRRNLSSLNKSLHGEMIFADREKVGLKPGSPVLIDCKTFHDTVERARKHSHSENRICSSCMNELEEAINLYRGDFLSGFNLQDCPEFDEWQFFQREGFKQELAWALEQLGNGYAILKEWEKAIKHVRNWVSQDRLNESAQRKLIELYAQNGQRNAAIRQYEECQRILKNELGQELGKQTKNLYQRLLASTDDTEETAVRNESLLLTKLYIPPVRPDAVERARLTALIEQGTGMPLTLVSAPAGFGKTTLLSAWAAQSGNPVGWVSLDEADNDVVRFLSYMIAALQNIQEGIGRTASTMIKAVQRSPIPSILTTLMNEVGQEQQQFVVILDDYHVINAEQVREAMTFILEHQPKNLHLVIDTRADPFLPLTKLRARNQLMELREKDLRFTTEEVKQFIHQAKNVKLSERDIEVLSVKTEGWGVGLQMAALSLQDREDASQFVQSFSGTHRYILDYLSEEVLQRQSEEVRDFLLKTSILERMCASLCEAVLENKGGRAKEILKELERRNVFVMPLDEEGTWYRYHRLFSDLLNKQLEVQSRGIIPQLHSKASQWFEKNGMIEDALKHALTIKDHQRVSKLLESNFVRLFDRGERTNLMRWLESRPEEVLCSSPLLCVVYARLCLVAGEVERSEIYLDSAKGFLTKEWSKEHPLETASLQGMILGTLGQNRRSKGEFESAQKLFQKALNVLPQEEVDFRTQVRLAFATNCIYLGQIQKSESLLQDLVKECIESSDYFNAADALCRLATAQSFQGKIGASEENSNIALNMSEKYEQMTGKRSYFYCDAHNRLSFCHYYRNELDEALEHVKKCIDEARFSGLLDDERAYNILLAMILNAKGDREEAYRVMEEAIMAATKLNPVMVENTKTYKIGLLLQQGRVDEAYRLIREEWEQIDPKKQVSMLEIFKAQSLARVWVARGAQHPAELERALKLIDKVMDSSGKQTAWFFFIQNLILQGEAYFIKGEREKSAKSLIKALDLSEPEQYSRGFIECGAMMVSLLRNAISHGYNGNFGMHMLEYIEKTAGTPKDLGGGVRVLVDPLSEQEEKVLRLLSTSLSGPEIAGELVVSMNTLHTHIQNIYMKLEVHNRREAVEKAGKLKLL